MESVLEKVGLDLDFAECKGEGVGRGRKKGLGSISDQRCRDKNVLVVLSQIHIIST